MIQLGNTLDRNVADLVSNRSIGGNHMKNSIYEMRFLTFIVPIMKFTFVTKNGNKKGQNQVKWEQERTKSSKMGTRKDKIRQIIGKNDTLHTTLL